MNLLSTHSKEALKTALAMTIAYGIALWMDWDKPMWAGFAVAFISLATVGQSLNKGVLRVMGTLLAVMVSLTVLALFPQERWWYMVALSAFIGFCTYMMGGPKHQYFWNVAGFVSAIICMEAGTSVQHTFQLAVLRAEETALGVLVYSLVAILLWPTSTREALDKTARQLAATQHELYRRYRKLLQGEGEAEDTRPLRTQELQHFNQFSQALTAAQTDTYDVHEVRQQWQQVRAQREKLMAALERWREGLKEVRDLDLATLMPTVEVLGDEIDSRFAQIGRMLDGQPPEQAPRAAELKPKMAAVRALSHFDKAALAVTRTQLLDIEASTRSLFEVVADIKGFGTASPEPVAADTLQPRFIPDLDRIAAAVRVMAGMWIAYLLWIYTEIPGGTGFVIFSVSVGMALASMPQIPVSVLFVPAAAGVAFASILYVFVMPQLSTFAGLGLMIFAVTFAICYLYHTPRQMIGRALGLALFVTIAGISNQQSYNFLSVANTAMMFPLIFALMAATASIPFSTQPEKAFQRLLGRFFHSCEYLMSTMRWDPSRPPTRLDHWKKAVHAREVTTLPAKLTAWSRAIDTKVLPGTTPQQLQALTTILHALTYRIQDLLEARESPQAELLVCELLKDVRAWRVAVQDIFHRLSSDTQAAPAQILRERLARNLEHLEGRIQETLDKAVEAALSDLDGERFYRLLGAYRGVSEATIAYVDAAEGIAWKPWRESRF